jgi:hypothetical protein
MMAGGASATVLTTNEPPRDAAPRPEITLDEEEIYDVSLATFYVFDRENTEPAATGRNVREALGCCVLSVVMGVMSVIGVARVARIVRVERP